MNNQFHLSPKHTSLSFIQLGLVLFALILVASCGTKKKVVIKKEDRDKPEVLFEEMIQNQINADWLEGKVKVRYSDKYQNLRGSGTIKMRKDSVIWMNVKALGFEVGRVLITKDSIFALMRLQRQYIAESLDYVERSYNMPADLGLIQNLILGNPLFFQTTGFNLEKEELSYHLFGKNDWIQSHYWLNDTDLSIQKMNFDDFRDGRKVNMTLEEYTQTEDNQNFSYFRKLELASEQTGNISVDIDFTKVELNIPMNINFEIPERYTRID